MDRPLFNPGAVNTAPVNKTPRNSSSGRVESSEKVMFNPVAAKAAVDAIQTKIPLREMPLGPLKAWSFSALMEFEGCPYRSFLKRVGGAKEPSGPAADRGSQLHKAIEDYIQGEVGELSKDVKKHREFIAELRERFIDGVVEVEGDWGFTRDWTVTGWTDKDTWARIKLDAIIHENDTSALVIDWKSGKKFGNELKHAFQLMVYAIGAFKRYPNLEFVQGEMRYIDTGEELIGKYTRQDAERFLTKVEMRALEMTTATEFPPKPSKHNCKWCKLKEPLEGEDKPRCKWGII